MDWNDWTEQLGARSDVGISSSSSIDRLRDALREYFNRRSRSCGADIAQFEQAIRDSAGNPFAGLSAPQSVNAQLDRQPTPESLKRDRARLQAKFSATMARAKRLDVKGDRVGCTSALSQAKRMYIF